MCGKDITPSLGTARRSLFGPVNGEENRQLLRQMNKALDAKDTKRWNFDFASERPLPGRFQWEKVSASVPETVAEVVNTSATASATDTAEERSSKLAQALALRRRKIVAAMTFAPIQEVKEVQEVKVKTCSTSSTASTTATITEECHKRLHQGYRTPSPNSRRSTCDRDLDLGLGLDMDIDLENDVFEDSENSSYVTPVKSEVHFINQTNSGVKAALARVPSLVHSARKRKQQRMPDVFPIRKQRRNSSATTKISLQL